MGGEEESPSSRSFMERVKLYRLNDDGKWDDQGTGHATVDNLERSEELGLLVVGEEDNETLLLHRISSDAIYRKQEDTIISWRDPQYSTELALSFQENTGCSFIWDQIRSVQRSLQLNTLTDKTYHAIHSELKDLPPVELSMLPLILKAVLESSNADRCRVTELILCDKDFFRKLMNLFKICEDLKDIENLHLIYKIVRGIILLNCIQIFERIFADEVILDICGCLEYYPEAPRVHHRDFLKKYVIFKEAIPIKDPQVLSKIHQTYNIGYLKDIVLPRILDEATRESLNSIIHSNYAFVVSVLKDDRTFIPDIFAKIKSSETPAESRKNLVSFLHEFCSLCKSLQMEIQPRVFRDFLNEGIIDVITNILQSEDKKLILTGTDIFILFLNQDPNLTLSCVIGQDGVPLLGYLVKGMLTDFGGDMHCQFLDILYRLLDTKSSGSQRDTIIEIFYEKHFSQLIDAITSSCPVSSSGQSTSISAVSRSSSAKPEILKDICDLLCYCVAHHPFRIKCRVLHNNVLDKVLFLTQRREKYLVVAAVRFVKVLVSHYDDHLFNHIVKNNLFKPIIDAFVANGNRYNLLNSAMLEFFEHVQKENFKKLIKYIIDSFWGQLVNFAKFPSIHSLKRRYDQSLQSLSKYGLNDVMESRRRIDEHALEKGDHCNEDSSRTGGLVDYDEDGKDYKPPSRKQSGVSEDNQGALNPIRMKQKLDFIEDHELVKRCKTSKSTDGVLASVCSTSSQATSPSKSIAPSLNSSGTSHDDDKEEKKFITCSSVNANSDVEKSEDKHSDVEKSEDKHSDVENSEHRPTNSDRPENIASRESPCPDSSVDSLHILPEDRQQNGDNSPAKPSTKMAVDGS